MSGKHRLRKRKRRRRGNPAAQLLNETRTIAGVAPFTPSFAPPAGPTLPPPPADIARVRARFKLLQRSPDVR